MRYKPLKTSKECKKIVLNPVKPYQWAPTMNKSLENEMKHTNDLVIVSPPGTFSMGLFTKWILTVGIGV